MSATVEQTPSGRPGVQEPTLDLSGKPIVLGGTLGTVQELGNYGPVEFLTQSSRATLGEPPGRF